MEDKFIVGRKVKNSLLMFVSNDSLEYSLKKTQLPSNTGGK